MLYALTRSIWMGMTAFPPSRFSLIPPATEIAGHVTNEDSQDADPW